VKCLDKYSIDVPSQENADEKINSFYSSRTPEATAAVETELISQRGMRSLG